MAIYNSDPANYGVVPVANEGGLMVGWCLISLVTSSNYQLEAGDREARYVMLGNIVSEWCVGEAGSQAAQWNH